MRPRVDRLLARFVLLLLAAWVVMTVSHECGHLLGGFFSGARLVDFDLVPWRLPYSVHSPDPHPLVTLWAGPLFGVAAPLMTAFLIRRPAVTFIADFCLLANGVYLSLAWLSGDKLLDTRRLLDAGASPFGVASFCALTTLLGYFRFRKDCVAHFVESKSTDVS